MCRGGVVPQDGAQDLGEAVTRKRAGAREHLVEDRAEAENIRPRVERPSLCLLRRHVGGRAHDGSLGRSRPVPIRIRGRGQTEIEEFQRARRCDQHVRRLEIAVEDAVPVRLLERTRHLNRQPHCVLHAKGAPQRAPVDVIEDQIVRSDVVDLTDVRMIQRGNGARLALEPIVEGIREPLDRHKPTEPRVARLPDLAHPASADGSENFIRTETSAGLEGHLWVARIIPVWFQVLVGISEAREQRVKSRGRGQIFPTDPPCASAPPRLRVRSTP